MPITLHKPSVLCEMEKHELINHIDDLTEFIEIFTGENIQDLANQIRDLKKENKILQSKSVKHYDAMEKLIESEGKRVQIVFKKITKRDNQIKERDNQIKELLQEIGTGKKLLKESKEWGTKLVEEMEKIKKDCCSKEIYDSVCKENQELLEEIDKLKEDLKKSRSINTTNRREKAELRKEIKELITDNKELMSAEKQFEFNCNYLKCYYDFLTAETNMKPDKDFIRDWCLEHGLGLELRTKLIASIL